VLACDGTRKGITVLREKAGVGASLDASSLSIKILRTRQELWRRGEAGHVESSEFGEKFTVNDRNRKKRAA